jgi:hypothetical protein
MRLATGPILLAVLSLGPLPRVFLRTRAVWPPKALTMRTDAKEVPIAIAALLVLIAIAALPG